MCDLLSESSGEDVDVIFPFFEEEGSAPINYTHAHYEAAALDELFKLENHFRDFYERMLKEFCTQKEIMERMFVLSQRYALLVSTGPCCKYPEIYAAPAEEVLICEINAKRNLVVASNNMLFNALDDLRTSCLVFDKLCSHLNFEYKTDFILGDAFHKPIKYFMELVHDLFVYLHYWLLRAKLAMNQFDPVDFKLIEAYKLIIDVNQDFEAHLLKGLVYCKCLHVKPICIITNKILTGQGSQCNLTPTD